MRMPSSTFCIETRVAPPAYFAALSIRLAITRTRRRLSARMTIPASSLSSSTGTVPGADHDTAWLTSSPRRISLRSSRAAPASKREISSRSSTSCRKRPTSATMRSIAAWADASGISARREASTSIDAESVMTGERSSWLTSDANRPSRSMRSSSAEAMWLNEVTNTPRSGSSSAPSRVSSRPPAIASAARETSANGRRVRRLVHQPRAAPAIVVRTAAPNSVVDSDLSVFCVSVKRHELVVRRPFRGQRNADDQLELTVDLRAHASRLVLIDEPAERERKLVLPELGHDGNPRRMATGRRDPQDRVRAAARELSWSSRSFVSLLAPSWMRMNWALR